MHIGVRVFMCQPIVVHYLFVWSNLWLSVEHIYYNYNYITICTTHIRTILMSISWQTNSLSGRTESQPRLAPNRWLRKRTTRLAILRVPSVCRPLPKMSNLYKTSGLRVLCADRTRRIRDIAIVIYLSLICPCEYCLYQLLKEEFEVYVVSCTWLV